LRFVFYYATAYLLVGEKFDAGIGENAEECCRVTLEETTYSGADVDVADCRRETTPRAGVFRELGVAGLEEDFYAVEGAYYRLCLLGC
jgi:hypothetical protein